MLQILNSIMPKERGTYVHNPEGGGIDPTNGTLAISGNLDLSEDFKVNGNVTVSGNVTGTGTLSATGTITVSGSTEATVNAGATLDECDISIDNGTTTFNSDTTVADGKVSVGGTGVTNAADCVVNCDMEIESTYICIENLDRFLALGELILTINGWTAYGIKNSGVFEIREFRKLTITDTGVMARSVYFIYNDGELLVNGDVNCLSTDVAMIGFLRIIYNNASLRIAGNIDINMEYGTAVYNNGDIFIVGSINIVRSAGAGVYNYGSITGDGTITDNGAPYTW